MPEVIDIDAPAPLSWPKRAVNSLLHNPATAYANTKLLDVITGENDRSTRLMSIGALGGLALITSGAEFGHLVGLRTFGDSFSFDNYMTHSGRHFLIGYLGAALVRSRSRWNNWKGSLAGAAIFNTFIELLQASIVTGGVHGGPENIPTYFSPHEWEKISNGEGGDLAGATAGGAMLQLQNQVARERTDLHRAT